MVRCCFRDRAGTTGQYQYRVKNSKIRHFKACKILLHLLRISCRCICKKRVLHARPGHSARFFPNFFCGVFLVRFMPRYRYHSWRMMRGDASDNNNKIYELGRPLPTDLAAVCCGAKASVPLERKKCASAASGRRRRTSENI